MKFNGCKHLDFKNIGYRGDLIDLKNHLCIEDYNYSNKRARFQQCGLNNKRIYDHMACIGKCNKKCNKYSDFIFDIK